MITMKYGRRMLAGLYVLLTVVSILSLSGCRTWDHRGDDDRGDHN